MTCLILSKEKVRIKRKKGRSTSVRVKNENESESLYKDSTLYGTSKYLNHTQLKNESESLGLLNSRLVKQPNLAIGKNLESKLCKPFFASRTLNR